MRSLISALSPTPFTHPISISNAPKPLDPQARYRSHGVPFILMLKEWFRWTAKLPHFVIWIGSSKVTWSMLNNQLEQRDMWFYKFGCCCTIWWFFLVLLILLSRIHITSIIFKNPLCFCNYKYNMDLWLRKQMIQLCVCACVCVCALYENWTILSPPWQPEMTHSTISPSSYKYIQAYKHIYCLLLK